MAFPMKSQCLLGFAVLRTLCNNILEKEQSKTEAAEQTPGVVLLLW